MHDFQKTHDPARPTRTFPVCIVADDIELPANIGSLFRIADAFGAEKLFLTGCSAVPPNRKIRKTSRASEQAVPYEHRERALEVILQLKAAGYVSVCLEITTRSLDIRRFEAGRHAKLALILGSENTGVRQELLDVADYTVHIPMFGQNSSMNVATACAIGLFELTRAFMPAP